MSRVNGFNTRFNEISYIMFNVFKNSYAKEYIFTKLFIDNVTQAYEAKISLGI